MTKISQSGFWWWFCSFFWLLCTWTFFKLLEPDKSTTSVDAMSVQSQSSSLPPPPSSSITITSLTWNVENLKKNKYALKTFVDLVVPDFIFINETQTFQFEANTATDIFHSKYFYSLNSDDSFDQELPFIRNRSHGGTMVLWKQSLDQFPQTLVVVL